MGMTMRIRRMMSLLRWPVGAEDVDIPPPLKSLLLRWPVGAGDVDMPPPPSLLLRWPVGAGDVDIPLPLPPSLLLRWPVGAGDVDIPLLTLNGLNARTMMVHNANDLILIVKIN